MNENASLRASKTIASRRSSPAGLRSSRPMHAAAADILLPSLMTESAVAMAARGLEDADAELAILCRDFPTYPRLASAQLRRRLVQAVRGGDRDTACAVARARTVHVATVSRPPAPIAENHDAAPDADISEKRAL
jgi:hypothetical protein